MTETTPKESADFSRPIAVLKSCHELIRLQCDALRQLSDHLSRHGPDDEARRTALDVVRHLDRVARLHNQDEEQDLLPRMVAASTMSRGSVLTQMVAETVAGHREMARRWAELRASLQDLAVTQETIDPLQVDRFVKLCRTHLAVEESNVFPLAEMLLSKHDLSDIGSSMAQRRAGG